MRRAPTTVWDCAQQVVHGLGYCFVGAQYARRGKGGLLRVYIDHERGVDIEDCARVSEQLSAVLDVEDPIGEAYVLEVSSPGLDRPLFRQEDFAQVVGQKVRLKLAQDLNGRRNFSGGLVAVGNHSIRLQGDGEAEPWELPLAAIEEARLVPQFAAKPGKRKRAAKN